jgi:hypothetical protein
MGRAMRNTTDTHKSHAGSILAQPFTQSLDYADASDTVAKDFIGLRRRGIAGKAAIQATAAFHGLHDTTVQVAYMRWEQARQEYFAALA